MWCVEVGATDLLDEIRVVFSETSLDLVEDALSVIVEWHPCPPAVGDPTAITDYKEAVPKGGTLYRGRSRAAAGDRGRPRSGRARSRGWSSPSETPLDPVEGPLDVVPAAGAEQRQLLRAGQHESARLYAQQTDAPSRAGERSIELTDRRYRPAPTSVASADGARSG